MKNKYLYNSKSKTIIPHSSITLLKSKFSYTGACIGLYINYCIDNDSISFNELLETFRVSQSQLYKILKKLEQYKYIKKVNKKYHYSIFFQEPKSTKASIKTKGIYLLDPKQFYKYFFISFINAYCRNTYITKSQILKVSGMSLEMYRDIMVYFNKDINVIDINKNKDLKYFYVWTPYKYTLSEKGKLFLNQTKQYISYVVKKSFIKKIKLRLIQSNFLKEIIRIKKENNNKFDLLSKNFYKFQENIGIETFNFEKCFSNPYYYAYNLVSTYK